MRGTEKGFTLIEILIVIAIIAILSGIVLANLNNGRSSANDAAIKTNLSNLRQQAAFVFDNSNRGCYSNTTTACSGALSSQACINQYSQPNSLFADSTIQNQINDSLTNGGGLSSCNLSAGATNYAVIVQLRSDPALAWCVDSSGQSKRVGAPGGGPLIQSDLNTFITGYKCN